MVNDPSLSEDALLGGKIRFFQPEEGYRVAVDPIFLASAVPAEDGEQILDVGAGTGAALLCLATRMPGCRLVGIELQRDLLRIANTNIQANGFEQRAEMIAGDLATPPPRLMAASFDHVMTNPPFHPADTSTASPSRQRADAHIEGKLDLAGWMKNCLMMLRNGGCLTVIHRADRLGELLAAIDGSVGDAVIFPLWPKGDGRPAKRILIQGWKGAKGPLRLAQGLIVHEDDGSYSEVANSVLRTGNALLLRPPRAERPSRDETPPPPQPPQQEERPVRREERHLRGERARQGRRGHGYA